MVFLISVPVGLFGTVWAYLKLGELSMPRRTRVIAAVASLMRGGRYQHEEPTTTQEQHAHPVLRTVGARN